MYTSESGRNGSGSEAELLNVTAGTEADGFARQQWGWGWGVLWTLHVVGFGSGFCLALPVACVLHCCSERRVACCSVQSGSESVERRRTEETKRKRLCAIVLIGALVAFAATLRGVALLAAGLLPARFVRVCGAALHPSYVTALYFLQYALHLATRVNLVLAWLHNPLFVAPLVLAHFAVCLGAEFAPSHGRAAFALVFLRAFFVFWCYFVDAVFFAFCLKVRSYLLQLADDIRAWQLRTQLAHGPYASTCVPAPAPAPPRPALVLSRRQQHSVRVLHAKYFGTCGQNANAVYTGMNDVDYDNLVVSISDINCSVSFSAKLDKITHNTLSHSTTTTSIAERLSLSNTNTHELPPASNLSPLSSDAASRNGDLSSDSTFEPRKTPQSLPPASPPRSAIDRNYPISVAAVDSCTPNYQDPYPYPYPSLHSASASVSVAAPSGYQNSVSLSKRCVACARILHFGYATALGMFLLCVLQTYAIFGTYSYAIYDPLQVPNLNAWMTFQSLHRFVELVNTILLMGILIAIRRFGYMRVKKI